jgi:hypothetical protein
LQTAARKAFDKPRHRCSYLARCFFDRKQKGMYFQLVAIVGVAGGFGLALRLHM